MNVPENLNYAESHEWIESGDGPVKVGITDHAQGELSDVVYVELPEAGRVVAAGETVAVVESVKAASDIYSPVAGTVTAVNAQVEGDCALVNSDPFGEGWLFQIEPEAGADRDGLLDAAGYRDLIG